PDADLSGPGTGIGQVDELKDLRAAEPAEPNCLHDALLPRKKWRIVRYRVRARSGRAAALRPKRVSTPMRGILRHDRPRLGAAASRSRESCQSRAAFAGST